MNVAFLTSCMGNRPFGEVVRWAAENGFRALEIASGHLDLDAIIDDQGNALRSLLDTHGVAVSAVAHYSNLTPADPDAKKAAIAQMHKVMDAAALIGAPVLCAMAGMPQPGKNKEQVIKNEVAGVWRPLCEKAVQKGLKVAFENWYATLLQNLPMWRLVFQEIGAENCGLEFDPSHLYHQGIDYLAAVDEFAPKIFHTHAKDTEVRQHVLRDVGNQAGGWWRYCIPGYGGIDWGQYIGRLRGNGFNGTLSIEHEDAALGVEEGLLTGKRFLERYI